MLGGGITRGTSTLLLGPAGTGKSVRVAVFAQGARLAQYAPPADLLAAEQPVTTQVLALGYTSDEINMRCLSAEQVAACFGHEEGAECSVAGAPGASRWSRARVRAKSSRLA